MRLLEENTDVATEIDVPVSEEQHVTQRRNSNHKFIPIECIENTENKRRNFSHRNVETSLYLHMMLVDDSTIIRERQIKCLKIERLGNEFTLTYIPRGQSTLMTNCVAEQILGKWLGIVSTNLNIYSLDIEAIMEVELNDLKNFCIIPFESSKEKKLIELNQ